MIKFVLMDVEGTTTDIRFVKEKLFPYAYEKMGTFVREHFDKMTDARHALGASAPSELESAFKKFIDEDRKDPHLKEVQGKIWKEGYASGELKGHVYPDVPEALRKWKEAGIVLGVYSSGSVAAQKLLYAHSSFGDLTGLLSKHFDLAAGGKKERQSYQNILKDLENDLGLGPESVLFLSDIEEELDAARAAGMKTGRLFRDEAQASSHPSFKSFEEIDLSRL